METSEASARGHPSCILRLEEPNVCLTLARAIEPASSSAGEQGGEAAPGPSWTHLEPGRAAQDQLVVHDMDERPLAVGLHARLPGSMHQQFMFVPAQPLDLEAGDIEPVISTGSEQQQGDKEGAAVGKIHLLCD